MSKKHRGHAKGDPVTYQTPLDAPQDFLDEALRERQVREMAQDTPLMRALGLAHQLAAPAGRRAVQFDYRDRGGRRH